MKLRRAGIVVLLRAAVGAAAAGAFWWVRHFALDHRVFERDSACEDIPPGSVVLALGFEYGRGVDGSIIPGEGNHELARRLIGCASRLSMVLTQKAISEALRAEGALDEAGRLAGQVPVAQMHDDVPGKPVRTFEALELALAQLSPPPPGLVLLAHDKQAERARADLAALYPGEITMWQVNDVPYFGGDDRDAAFSWAWRELFASARDWGLRGLRWASGAWSR